MIMAPSALSGHRQPAPRARLVCKNPEALGSPAGQEILLDTSEVTIGRAPEHAISLKADGISRNHAKFFPGDGAWGVEDMGSTNGVLVNGAKAHQAWLKNGDLVLLGTVQYQFEFVKASVAETEEDAMAEAEKTVVMRPTVKREATGQGAPAQAPASRPAAAVGGAARTQTNTRPAAASRSAAAREKPSGSGSGIMLIIALAVVVIAAVAFMVL